MALATGFFDGVHLGHRFVIDKLVSLSKEKGEESIVVTFWPHPRNVLQDDARELRLLTTLDEKKSLLSAAGVDRVEVIPFTRAFSRLTAEEYLRDYVSGRFKAKTMLLGYDNRLGSDGAGPDKIGPIAERLGIEVVKEGCIEAGGVRISSTKIRSLLSLGKIEEAAEMLGYNYSLKGVVVAGNRLGRTIGYPTANMELYEPLKLIPHGGVYSVEVETLGKKFRGMCNIGVRPTVGQGNALTIETNIFDFDEDIYGLDIEIRFLRRIRDEKRFDSLKDLSAQLALDEKACRAEV
jgi:riboflavin kinase/FMN adenylyltransferase